MCIGSWITTGRYDVPGSSVLTGCLFPEQAGSAGLLLVRIRELGLPYPRMEVHRALPAGIGGTIVLLAFYQAWLVGLVAVGHDTRVWPPLLIVSNSR